ncbi:AAA family ATPase [Candidatus Micrarchaeota archaeon]|nr:AAA family ATPase [Candidatus Micrarchaeota archaeon]
MKREKEESVRVPTGIPGLDSMIEGGFERNSIVMVAGEAGAGKSIFANQFLYNGIVKFNEPGLYISFEESKEEVYRRMRRFGWDFKKLEKEKRYMFVNYPPNEIERFINDAPYIKDMVDELGIKRVVIDSVTSLVLLQKDAYLRRTVFLKTMAMIKRWGCTALLTSEAKQTVPGEIRARYGLEYLVDGFIAIHFIRKRDLRERALEVVKMRGTAHEIRLVPMRITSDGIHLYRDQPVFD